MPLAGAAPNLGIGGRFGNSPQSPRITHRLPPQRVPVPPLHACAGCSPERSGRSQRCEHPSDGEQLVPAWL